ncbi:MAG: porin family protein [Rhodomicrobium sp.]|nr:porin family protein [Rhodomicrobium sp.]
MSFIHKVLPGVFLLSLFSFGAHAADLGDKREVSLKDTGYPLASDPWSGPYIGIHIGYGSADISSRDGGTDIHNPPFGAFACGPAATGNYCDDPFELDAEGVLGGIQLGYNVRNGNFLLGVEGELGWLNIDEEKTLIRPQNDRDFLSAEYGLYGTLALRAGLIYENALLYVKGGAAIARIETEAADIDENGGVFEIFPGSFISDDGIETGFAVGGGVEYALSEKIAIKAEYLYMDFGSSKAVSPQGDIYKTEHSLHTAKVGLNFNLSGQLDVLK